MGSIVCLHAEPTPNAKMVTSSQQTGSLLLRKHVSAPKTSRSHMTLSGRTSYSIASNALRMQRPASTISLTSLVRPSRLLIMAFARTPCPSICQGWKIFDQLLQFPTHPSRWITEEGPDDQIYFDPCQNIDENYNPWQRHHRPFISLPFQLCNTRLALLYPRRVAIMTTAFENSYASPQVLLLSMPPTSRRATPQRQLSRPPSRCVLEVHFKFRQHALAS